MRGNELFAMCGGDILAMLDLCPTPDMPEEYLVEDDLFDDLISGSTYDYTRAY